MKKIVFILACVFVLAPMLRAETNTKLKDVKLEDANGDFVSILNYGQKVFLFFYVDPDVHEITNPISQALELKKYPKEDFEAVGVVNCKDTWVPNAAIQLMVRQKHNKYPESLIFLDENHLLPMAWRFSGVDDKAVLLVVDWNSQLKYMKIIKSESEAIELVPGLLKVIDDELKIKKDVQ